MLDANYGNGDFISDHAGSRAFANAGIQGSLGRREAAREARMRERRVVCSVMLPD